MSVTRPNIVLIMTDQERFPRHMDQVDLRAHLPNRHRLYDKGVSYQNFYINAAPCTPNRSVIFTGLYTQQTWMVGNAEMKQPDMDPAFPTFGTALKELGYATNYFGKWHLSTEPSGKLGLDAYGFENFALGEEFHGDANQGGEKDPIIAKAAADFLQVKQSQPFLAVISFINPHDIMYFPDGMIPAQSEGVYEGMDVPPNFETLQQLRQRKPDCQAQYKRLYEAVMGDMPDDINSEAGRNAYVHYMNYYLWLQTKVDAQIGVVLDALESSENRQNTIVIFTADHGDQIGSHGLSGKQCLAYEESLHVPFCVRDYSDQVIPADQAGSTRSQFGSSIDIFPTVLSIALNGEAWPENYKHLRGVDLKPNLRDASQPTKNEVLFTYDFNLPGVVFGPDHIRCSITQDWKGAVYNHWQMDNANQPQPDDPDAAVSIRKGVVARELYSRSDDPLEMNNLANSSTHADQMAQIEAHLDQVLETELRAPLPQEMQAASDAAKAGYVSYQVYGPAPMPEEIKKFRKDYLG
ncbi:sulfatase-like hydrolase/transferase [Massilia sp. W12]|uniref:sulfatase-like hydrolase/transferase n=1 Tax=Massilia sp. W12 TaxID=3126507 RepID=UPI0030CD1DEA